MRLRLLAALGALAALIVWLAMPGGHFGPPRRPDPDPANTHGSGAPRDSDMPTNAVVSVERTTPSDVSAPKAPVVSGCRFEIHGVASSDFRGSVILHPRDGNASSIAIADRNVVIPTTELRKVEFVVPGYCIAEYGGPFVEIDPPVRVELTRAGEIIVEVIDEDGRLLANRLVYCFPLKDSPTDGLVSYRTTQWATSDDSGVARIANVVPGDYRVSTAAIAEWQEAEVLSVQVAAATPANCTLKVPVLAQEKFGGFVLDVNQAEFLSSTPAGVVRQYQFWTIDGRPYKIHRLGKSLRCVVPGQPGEILRGRIEWRDSQRVVQLPSKRSDEITVTVGAVIPVTVAWTDAQSK